MRRGDRQWNFESAFEQGFQNRPQRAGLSTVLLQYEGTHLERVRVFIDELLRLPLARDDFVEAERGQFTSKSFCIRGTLAWEIAKTLSSQAPALLPWAPWPHRARVLRAS
jgi:hypothetical protein